MTNFQFCFWNYSIWINKSWQIISSREVENGGMETDGAGHTEYNKTFVRAPDDFRLLSSKCCWSECSFVSRHSDLSWATRRPLQIFCPRKKSTFLKYLLRDKLRVEEPCGPWWYPPWVNNSFELYPRATFVSTQLFLLVRLWIGNFKLRGCSLSRRVGQTSLSRQLKSWWAALQTRTEEFYSIPRAPGEMQPTSKIGFLNAQALRQT